MDASHRLFMVSVVLLRMRRNIDDAITKCDINEPLMVDEILRLMSTDIAQLQRDLVGPISREWIRIGVNSYKEELAEKSHEQSSDSR